MDNESASVPRSAELKFLRKLFPNTHKLRPVRMMVSPHSRMILDGNISEAPTAGDKAVNEMESSLGTSVTNDGRPMMRQSRE